MAGSRRVQSARSSDTLRAAKSANTSALARVVFLLYWQVMHQAAVKSTNTGLPAASSASTRPGAQACHWPKLAGAISSPDADADACAAWAVGASSIFKTFWPKTPANSAQTAIEMLAKAKRLRPFRPKDQTTSAKPSSRASRLAAPSTPLRCPSTHSSQTTVAHIKKAMKWRRESIQAPGRGSQRPTAGTQAATR